MDKGSGFTFHLLRWFDKLGLNVQPDPIFAPCLCRLVGPLLHEQKRKTLYAVRKITETTNE